MSKSGNKTDGGPGISSALERELRQRIERLERNLGTGHSDQLLQEWTGQVVRTRFLDDTDVVGKLLWVDKFNFCLEHIKKGRVLINKGTIAGIWKEGPETSS